MPSSSASEAVSAPSPQADPAAWALALSQRLKYLQETMPEETPENRHALLEAELRRHLQAIPANKRGLYLDAFAEKVPSWDFGAVIVRKPMVRKADGTPPSPEEGLALFLQIAPGLSAEQRDQLVQKLAALGFPATSGARPFSEEAWAELQTKFKLTPEDKVENAQVGKLFVLLAELMVTVDQLTWSVWRNVAPKSTIRRDNSRGDLRAMLRRALSGDAETLQKQLESTRGLIAGLLAGLGQAGKNFARRYEKQYAPDVVREAVRLETGRVPTDENCWKKYEQIAAELNTATIETDVQDAVVKYAEDLMGRQREKA